MKYTNNKLQTLQDKDLLLSLENSMPGGIGSVMPDRYVKSDDNEKILDHDANKFYGWARFQMLPHDEVEMWFGQPDLYMNKLRNNLNTPDDSGIDISFEVDFKYYDNIKQKTFKFPFCRENKFSPQDKFTSHMNKIKPNNYTKIKKKVYSWTDKKNYLIQYRLLNFYVRYGS